MLLSRRSLSDHPPWYPSQHTLSRLLPLQVAHGSLPRPGNVADGDKLLELVRALNEAKGEDKVEVDEGVLRKFASGGVCVCGGRGRGGLRWRGGASRLLPCVRRSRVRQGEC